MKRARMVGIIVAFALPLFSGAVTAQTQARILSGFPPGGAVDALARIFAEKLAESIGRPVVVETRAGAAGQIAAMALKAALSDGNTLMVAPDSMMTLYPHTVNKPVYDTLADFVPVAHVGGYPIAFAISASVPARDLREYLSWVRSGARNASYGSAGAGTTLHFLGLMVGQATGVPLVHVAYRGVGPALADAVAGQIPAVILPLGTLLPQASAGKVRIVAHSGGRRSPVAPDVPTFKELGYPALEASGWFGLFAPAGVRPEVVTRINRIVIQATRSVAVRDKMRALDLEIREMTPRELSVLLRTDYDRWGPVVKASGFSADSR